MQMLWHSRATRTAAHEQPADAWMLPRDEGERACHRGGPDSGRHHVTVIVGIVHPGGVLLAGDAVTSDGSGKLYQREPKVHRLGDEMVVGATGDTRWIDQWRGIKPPPSKRMGAEGYLRECVVPLVVPRVKDPPCEGEALIGFRGRLFVICNKFSVIAILGSYWAIGSGERVAQGALFATVGQPPRKRAIIALQAAKALVAYIDGPWGFVELAKSTSLRREVRS
jgi:ATP-dependent protease HslVU (ClpYQ) peptidase subunit